MSDIFANGFYLRNVCITQDGVVSLRMEAYDANKQHMTQKSPDIPYPSTRYISTDHVGSADLIYLLIFFETENYNPPPGIGIIQGVEGGGGSVGITVLGTGGSLGASATVTKGYSQPSACLLMNLVKYYYPASTPLYATGEVGIKTGTLNEFVFTDTHGSISVQGPLLGS